MSRAKYVAVLATMSDYLPLSDPDNRSVWLFEANEHYSLEAAQRFFAKNEPAFGGVLTARYEMMTFKSVRRLIEWADRKKRNAYGLAPLTGWNGPFVLAPACEAERPMRIEGRTEG